MAAGWMVQVTTVLLCLHLAWPARATGPETWAGPTAGPVAQVGKSVVYVASDFKNASHGVVYRGLQEAARSLRWTVAMLDGKGASAQQAKVLADALAAQPHAVIFGGFDPGQFPEEVAALARKNIVLAGWHAAKAAGPTDHLFVNVTTDPLDVARLAAQHVIQDAQDRQRPVGVVIFNDPQFSVANAKTEAMKKTIEACRGYKGCRVLAVESMAISRANEDIPKAVPRLVATHGVEWTYSLAINDAYFDAINFPLKAAKRPDILNVSAGDGSSSALSRIAWGQSQQLATVAEPLKMQAYQLADELNRAFAGQPPSGYMSRPILVTHERLRALGTADIESGLGFEAGYGAIWHRK